MRFLEEFDQEKYFELLKAWKYEEESYLNEHPHLRFEPKRHEKCLMSALFFIINSCFFFVKNHLDIVSILI